MTKQMKAAMAAMMLVGTLTMHAQETTPAKTTARKQSAESEIAVKLRELQEKQAALQAEIDALVQQIAAKDAALAQAQQAASTASQQAATAQQQAAAATSQAQGAGIAVDISNNIWVANAGQDSLVEMNQEGFILTPPPQGIFGGGLGGVDLGNTPPNAVAVDIFGNIFTLNSEAGTVSEFTPNRVAVSPSAGIPVGGNPPAFCIDSADLMYVSQPSNNSIEILSALSPAQGFIALINNPEVSGPAGIAVDASGNLWVANFGSGFSGSVTELVGIAFPTKTPIAAANQAESFEP